MTLDVLVDVMVHVSELLQGQHVHKTHAQQTVLLTVEKDVLLHVKTIVNHVQHNVRLHVRMHAKRHVQMHAVRIVPQAVRKAVKIHVLQVVAQLVQDIAAANVPIVV